MAALNFEDWWSVESMSTRQHVTRQSFGGTIRQLVLLITAFTRMHSTVSTSCQSLLMSEMEETISLKLCDRPGPASSGWRPDSIRSAPSPPLCLSSWTLRSTQYSQVPQRAVQASTFSCIAALLLLALLQ